MTDSRRETLVSAFFSSILMTFAAGIGTTLALPHALSDLGDGGSPSSRVSVLTAVGGVAILVAGCVAASMILAGWAREPLGRPRFAAASLCLLPLPFVTVLPALAAGAVLGFWAAVVAYGVLATGYAYCWARLVGRWARGRSRRA